MVTLYDFRCDLRRKAENKLDLTVTGGTVIRGSWMPFFKLAFSTVTAVCVHVVAVH